MRHSRLSFGKYQVLAHLGQGGMGHVYLTLNVGPGGVQKLLVIKQLREDFAMQASARAMFLDEARVSTRLNHPNIVQTNEIVDDEEDLYLVMEFLDGQPLSRILDPAHGVGLSRAAKLRILAEALGGLHYAHELTDYDGTPLNVVHRDVSPQNILVTYDGHVKLVDFGVAKAADAKTITASGVFKGKVRYASPEQALCASVDRRADVFAMGTVLWEVLSGRRLWQDEAEASVMLALASGKIPRIREACPDLPPELEAICNKALATDVNDRYATALELRDALLDHLGELSDDTDIGRALSTAFAAERRRLHAVIDAQVKAAREATASAQTVRHIPLLGPESASSLTSEKSVVRGGLSLESEGRSRPTAGPKTSSSRVMALGAAAVLAVVGALAMLVPSGRSQVSAAASPAPLDAHVHVSLRATPPSARFTLDGRTLEANPYEGEMKRDDAGHRLSIRAEGFESRDMDARLARDLSVDVMLAAVTLPGGPSAAPGASPPVSPPVDVRPTPRPSLTPAPPTKGARDRRIDEDDPYKR